MTQYLVTKDKLDALAVSVSDKSGEELPLTIDEMREAVNGIETGGGTPTLQAKTRTISAAGTFVDEPDMGYDGLSSVTTTVPEGEIWVSANHQFYTESNVRKWRYRGEAVIDTNDGSGTPGFIADETYVNGSWNPFNAIAKNTTVTPSPSAQTIGGAYYMMEGAVTVAAMPSGSVSASATKGSVSNHAISVTPTATVGTAGYLAAGSTNGTAVTVTASELASGNKEITENGTGIDVVGYSTVSVDVQGGGSDVSVGTSTVTISSAAATLLFSSILGEPTSLAVVSTTNISVPSSGESGKTAVAVYDGVQYPYGVGECITNQNNSQVDPTAIQVYFDSGDLYVTSSGSDWSAGTYKLMYTYNGTAGNIGTQDVQVGSGATSITFTGLEDEPTCWSCVFRSNFSTSSGYQRVIGVVYDGTNIYGMEMDSSAKYSDSHWSYTYNNGSLTITSQGTNAGGYFHQPGNYHLTYAIAGDQSLQTKTVTPTTSTQNVTADTAQGYTALKEVVVNPIPSQYIVPTGNKPITANGNNIDVAEFATVSVNVSGGGTPPSVATTTWTNSSNTTTSHQFTGLLGTPIAAFLRCTSSLSRSSSSTNYFIADMVWNGSTCKGNSFRRSNGTYADVTSGYSVTTGTNSITFTSSGTSTTNPGSFYNGTYELVYVY